MSLKWVRNMKSANGNPVANQFMIFTDDGVYFQSYRTVIAKCAASNEVILQEGYWDMYSATTNKYLNQFLNTSGIAEIREKVIHGKYKVGKL